MKRTTRQLRRRPARRGFTLVEIMIVVSIIAVLLNIAAPSFVHARDSGQARSCIANLHNINTAKEQWAFQSSVSGGYALPALWANNGNVLGLSNYMRGNVPVCPATGSASNYSYGTVSTVPTCSYVLPAGSNVPPHSF